MNRQRKNSSRGRTPVGGPNPVDVHVGNRIRLRRTLLGLSQEKLASMLGLTFQQVQKYERGFNRVGASRLWDIGNVLEVPINFFFEDMDKTTANQSPRMVNTPDDNLNFLNEDDAPYSSDPMLREETLQLVRAYYKISDRRSAHYIFRLLLSLSKTESELLEKADEEDDEIK